MACAVARTAKDGEATTTSCFPRALAGSLVKVISGSATPGSSGFSRFCRRMQDSSSVCDHSVTWWPF